MCLGTAPTYMLRNLKDFSASGIALTWTDFAVILTLAPHISVSHATLTTAFYCTPAMRPCGRLTSQPNMLSCVQNIDGDGRWKIEWYGVPCNVGDGKLQYSFVMKDYYFFEFVVSNTRIPINGVSVYINGKWLDLARTHTNTWAYYRVRGFLSTLHTVCSSIEPYMTSPLHLVCANHA